MQIFKLILATILLTLAACKQAKQSPFADAIITTLPASFEANRIWLKPVAAAGDSMLFYLDTGGGTNMLYEGFEKKLKLPVTLRVIERDTFRLVPFPPIGASTPMPLPSADLPPFRDSLLLVKPMPDDYLFAGTGFLGRTWFAGGIWLLDYKAGTMATLKESWKKGLNPESLTKIGFQQDSTGARTTHFPRIQATVAGETLDFLFDTGASTLLTDSAHKAMQDKLPALRGTSFIRRSTYEKWKQAHPEWRVFTAAEKDLKADAIEVPHITLMGHTIGPVLFMVRNNKNFDEMMSGWMDKPVVGALGGSAFQYLTIVIDYPAAVAYAITGQ
jgi:hypothetical protein